MGSCVRYGGLERFVAKHGKRIEEENKNLIGTKVMKFLGTHVGHYVEAEVECDDGVTLVTHYRWSSEMEEPIGEENIELSPEDAEYNTPMMDYYTEYIIGGTITNLTVGYDRDDEAYLYCYINNTVHCLEIPLGVDPETVNENGDPGEWEPESLGQ